MLLFCLTVIEFWLIKVNLQILDVILAYGSIIMYYGYTHQLKSLVLNDYLYSKLIGIFIRIRLHGCLLFWTVQYIYVSLIAQKLHNIMFSV